MAAWESQPGHFTADRRTAVEYCHIRSGRDSVTNADGKGTRDVGPGELLVLPQGWTGEWVIHEQMRKLFIIDAAPRVTRPIPLNLRFLGQAARFDKTGPCFKCYSPSQSRSYS